jgi:hypothetical protein
MLLDAADRQDAAIVLRTRASTCIQFISAIRILTLLTPGRSAPVLQDHLTKPPK